MKIEILDTTLRDGEQTSGVSFSENEKLSIAKLLLEEIKVDRIEIASARVSEGETLAAKNILKWATKNAFLDKIEILGFVDFGLSIDWIEEVGGKVMNLLCKGSQKHCEKQLRKSLSEHISDIRENILLANERNINCNIYLEDWSNGMQSSKDYVINLIVGLQDLPIKRIMLPDTLGILNHEKVRTYCSEMVATFPHIHFDFHAHNDYDLATANVYEAVKSGILGIHTTLNGLGERAGNVSLSSVIGLLKDHLNIEMNVEEKKLYKVCKVVESFSGIRIPQNKPLIGEYVFTQTSGIHADGDSKDNLYQTQLSPDRFGRAYTYALGKMSGKSNIKKNLEALGIVLQEEDMKRVTKKIIELGDKKEKITQEDLPYIVKDVLGQKDIKKTVEILNYSLSVAKDLRPTATISLRVKDKTFEQSSSGDGQYDAFVNALKKIFEKINQDFPRLEDYEVIIPPGGNTDALVITSITWNLNNTIFKTKGLDSDQTVAAIKATTKMLNIMESKNPLKKVLHEV